MLSELLKEQVFIIGYMFTFTILILGVAGAYYLIAIFLHKWLRDSSAYYDYLINKKEFKQWKLQKKLDRHISTIHI
jgi:hypothetical protein